MEILDTHKFNEKLNIQPVSKEGLMKGSRRKTPKSILNKSGYLVTLGDLKHGKIVSQNVTYFYVTYEDMVKYNYEKKFNLIRYTQYVHESSKLEGTLIGYDNGFTAIALSEFDDNMQSASREEGAYWIGIYKKPPQQPYTPLDIKHSLSSDILLSYVNVWSSESGFNKFLTLEKLNIQPVTKDKLKSISNRYGYLKIGAYRWAVENCKETTCSDGSKLVKGVDYVIVDGNTYYTYEGAKKATPIGWHIPTRTEARDLMITAGNRDNLVSEEDGGIDRFGFNAKYTGWIMMNHFRRIVCKDIRFDFWLFGCSELPEGNAYCLCISKEIPHLRIGTASKETFMPIRLVKND